MIKRPLARNSSNKLRVILCVLMSACCSSARYISLHLPRFSSSDVLSRTQWTNSPCQMPQLWLLRVPVNLLSHRQQKVLINSSDIQSENVFMGKRIAKIPPEVCFPDSWCYRSSNRPTFKIRYTIYEFIGLYSCEFTNNWHWNSELDTLAKSFFLFHLIAFQ